MRSSKTYTCAALLLAMLSLSGCLGQIQNDTEKLVASMQSMDQNMGMMNQNMGSIAATMQGLQESADQAMVTLDERIESFENHFNAGVEMVEAMADSIEKLDRLFEMVAYVKAMSDSFQGLEGTFEKLDQLADEAMKVMDNLNINLDPSDAERNIENFISTEEEDEINELLDEG